MRLQGKCALVTGGASGIGRAIAIALAKEGADVAVGDLNMTGAMETVTAIEELGNKGIAIGADVSKKTDVVAMVETTLSTFSGIQILVNNAGITRPNSLELMSEDEWDAVIGVHAKGTFLCIQAVIPAMKSGGYGRIINVSSILGKTGSAYAANYAAAKAAIVALTKSAAWELAAHGITVNAILPGFIDTPLTQPLGEIEAAKQFFLGITPLQRVGRPEEVATATVFLATDEASYMTGVAMEVTGGFAM